MPGICISEGTFSRISLWLTDLVRVELPLGPQERQADVIDHISSAHLASTAASKEAQPKIESPASIRVVVCSNRGRGCVNDGCKITEILFSWRGENGLHQEGADGEERAQKPSETPPCIRGFSREHFGWKVCFDGIGVM